MIEFLRRLPRALLLLGRGAMSSIFGNLSLALLSVALGLSLWVFVIDQENPKEVQAFSSAIPVKFVNAPNDLAVSNTSETNVRVRVEATKSALSKLRADDFQATVDLGGYARGQASVAVEVTASSGGVDVVSTTPERIEVTLEDLRTKEVRVTASLLGSPQQGFGVIAPQQGDPPNPSTEPSTVTVAGAESLVALVESAVAEVNLTGLRANFSDSVELKARDVHGGDVSRVRLNPGRAKVSVGLEQKEFSQEFRVNPTITGAPAAGFNVGPVAVDPQLILVTGPLDVLQSIDAVRGIATEEISIADSRAEVVRSVQLLLPAGTRVRASPSVKVTIAVQPARGEATFSVVPQIRNIAAGLALVPPEPVLVTIVGDLPTLRALSPESIVVTADAQGLAAGLHALPVQVTPPPGTTLTRTDPGQLGIALAVRP